MLWSVFASFSRPLKIFASHFCWEGFCVMELINNLFVNLSVLLLSASCKLCFLSTGFFWFLSFQSGEMCILVTSLKKGGAGCCGRWRNKKEQTVQETTSKSSHWSLLCLHGFYLIFYKYLVPVSAPVSRSSLFSRVALYIREGKQPAFLQLMPRNGQEPLHVFLLTLPIAL